jgi:cellulose synthase/poly-beta-1,6-N-acetylglucosamine synthase-like glycosyltransferase
MAPRCTVLVCACEDSEALRSCLATVRKQAEVEDAEVILVLNAQERALDKSAVSRLERLCERVILEPRVGKSNALNRGVSAARGEVIAFTDDDAVPQDGWLARLTRPLLEPDRPLRLVGCGGRVVPVYGEQPPAWYRTLVGEADTHHLGPRHHLGELPVDYPNPPQGIGIAPLGANCAYRREIFDHFSYDPDLGPNRETGLGGGEDFEFGLRLMMAGYRLGYRPDAIVHHPVVPERLTLGFARRRAHAQGIETVRIRRNLGLPLPTRSAVRRAAWGCRLQVLLFHLLDTPRSRAPTVRLAKLRGRLTELERLARSASARRRPTQDRGPGDRDGFAAPS